MRSIIKAVLPRPVFQALRYQVKWRPVMKDWEEASSRARLNEFPTKPSNLVIFPADPETISGSLGDEAMMSAAMDYYRSLNPDVSVSMFCRTKEAEAAVISKGLKPVWLPPNEKIPAQIGKILSDGQYDTLVILGADIMDGYYNPMLSASIVAMADIAGKMGIDTTMLGFSFNASPAPELKRFFDKLDSRVRVNVRDAVSLRRFNRFTTREAQLVADSAFMMRPADVDAKTKVWVEQRKAEGLTVVGFNLHPMLKKHASSEEIDHMARVAASAIKEISSKKPVAWLLLPHDYRNKIGLGDGLSLQVVLQHLGDLGPDRVLYFDGEHHASVLKGAAGLTDAMVTARMHLAIAALGTGVPTMCLTYQDKFEGLFEHFNLPKTLLASNDVFDKPDLLRVTMDKFIDDIEELRRAIAEKLPSVKAASARNFGQSNQVTKGPAAV